MCKVAIFCCYNTINNWVSITKKCDSYNDLLRCRSLQRQRIINVDADRYYRSPGSLKSLNSQGDWPLTRISRSRYSSASNTSKCYKIAIFTMADWQEVAWSIQWCLFNDLEWPLTQSSRAHHIWRKISQKRYKIDTQRNTIRTTKQYNIIVYYARKQQKELTIWTYTHTRPTQRCNFACYCGDHTWPQVETGN